ncbi:structural cement protein Gp24 [Adonisia turfae]|uniref:Uncharacterized protein n=1 Tax=Adonisia turfae CCMR0081 TaxID=2292702 RepID=A0A6M0RFK4_9CYAN|nr:hypothetical protein [Adonisia turfae]NEZ55027.1 hypothetical protein [Adonisia turfae CCMR0081]
MAITNYQTVADRKGFEGQVATTEHTVIRTASNGMDGVLPFGRVIVEATPATRGESPVATVISAAGQSVLGVAIATTIQQIDHESIDANGDRGYADKRPVGYIVEGFFYGIVEEDVTPADPVFVRFGGTGKPGQFRTDADTASAEDLSARFKFAEVAAAGEVCKIEVLKR